MWKTSLNGTPGKHFHIPVMTCANFQLFNILKCLFDRLNLSLTIHVQCFLDKWFSHIETNFGFDFFIILRLEPRLFGGNVFRFTQPWNAFGMMPWPLWVLWCMHFFFEQFFIGWIQYWIRIGLIQISIDQINRYTQIMFSQYFVFVITFQRRWIVLNKSVCCKWIRNVFQIEWNVRQCIGVFHTAYQLRSEKRKFDNNSIGFWDKEPCGVIFVVVKWTPWNCWLTSFPRDAVDESPSCLPHYFHFEWSVPWRFLFLLKFNVHKCISLNVNVLLK